MNINQLKFFITIANTGSFSEASNELCLSQSCLSKQIISLENELGVQLFDRSHRTITLTPAGMVFLNNAKKLYNTYDNAIEELKEFTCAERGDLSIYTIPVMSQYNITSLLARFRNNYPGINISIQELECSTIIPALDNGTTNLAILRSNYLKPDKYRTWPLAYDELALVVSASHPQAKLDIADLQTLGNESFIFLDKNSGIYDISIKACKEAGFDPEISYTSSRIETIIGLICSGQGVALLMQKVVQYFSSSNIKILPLKKKVPSISMLVKHKSRELNSTEKLFVEFVKSNVDKI